MKSKIIGATVLVAMLSTTSIVHAAGEGSFAIKTGSFNMSEQTQNIGGFITTFDDSSSSVFAFEYEKNIKNNVSWGFEIINYSNDITLINGSPPISSISADTMLIMANGKKYFDVSKSVKPFIGGGIGISAVDLNGASASSIAFQGMAGIKFPFDNFSASVEYKLAMSDAEDSVGDKIDVSGSGLFAGIAFNF